MYFTSTPWNEKKKEKVNSEIGCAACLLSFFSYSNLRRFAFVEKSKALWMAVGDQNRPIRVSEERASELIVMSGAWKANSFRRQLDTWAEILVSATVSILLRKRAGKQLTQGLVIPFFFKKLDSTGVNVLVHFPTVFETFLDALIHDVFLVFWRLITGVRKVRKNTFTIEQILIRGHGMAWHLLLVYFSGWGWAKLCYLLKCHTYPLKKFAFFFKKNKIYLKVFSL